MIIVFIVTVFINELFLSSKLIANKVSSIYNARSHWLTAAHA